MKSTKKNKLRQKLKRSLRKLSSGMGKSLEELLNEYKSKEKEEKYKQDLKTIKERERIRRKESLEEIQNLEDEQKNALLFEAIREGNIEYVKRFIESNADIKAISKLENKTPIELAKDIDRKEIVTLLEKKLRQSTPKYQERRIKVQQTRKRREKRGGKQRKSRKH